MVNKVLLPQEIETFYIIPALRRQFAMVLKKKGLKQKDIAEILMVNTAAISQYRSSKRGSQLEFNQEIQDEIQKSTENITDNMTYMRETQHILKFIREKRLLCQFHKQFSNVPMGCDPVAMGCCSK